MKINTSEMIDEFGAVERWENEGGRISYTQFGLDAGVIEQAARDIPTASRSQFVFNEAANSRAGGAEKQIDLYN